MTTAIDVEDLSFAYQDQPVLVHVSFKIEEGKFVGIIGPNGGGKTTLLKILMGFLTPGRGSVKLFDVSPSQVLQSVAYVPQTARFDRDFPISVLELVLMGRLSCLPWYGRYRQEDLDAAHEALRKVGLHGLDKRAFGTLSGGQAQRALIARALVSNPRLLLLDEPTASVDAKTQREIYELLDQLRGQITILMVTHDLEVAIEHVDQVICVQKNVVSLTPKEVCEHFGVGLYHSPLITDLQSQKKRRNDSIS